MPKKKTKDIVEKPKRPAKLPLHSAIPTFIDEARNMYALGLRVDQIAKAFGITTNEFRTYIRDEPDLAKALYYQRALNVSKVAQTYYEKASSDDYRNNSVTMHYMDVVAGFDKDRALEDDLLPDDKSVTTFDLKITSTDPTEAMRQYERIMKD